MQVPVPIKRQSGIGGISACASKPGINGNPLDLWLGQRASSRGMSNGMGTRIVYKRVWSRCITSAVLIHVLNIV